MNSLQLRFIGESDLKNFIHFFRKIKMISSSLLLIKRLIAGTAVNRTFHTINGHLKLRLQSLELVVRLTEVRTHFHGGLGSI